jgi:hypothetical protein
MRPPINPMPIDSHNRLKRIRMNAPANQGVRIALAHGDGSTLSNPSTSNLQMEETL